MNKKYIETIKSVNGVVYNLAYHQQRLESVLSTLTNATIHNLLESLNPPQNATFRCRVVYDENNIEVEYIPYVKRQVRSLKLVYSDDIEYSKKYKNRELLDELFMLKADYDDILIVKSGLVTDTSIANIAFYDGFEWITPKRPLLKGTMRQKCLETKNLSQKDIFVDDLKNYKKVALMNAMIDFDIIAEENIEEIIC